MRNYGPSAALLQSDGEKPVTRLMGNAKKQEMGRWANNRVENSHLPFRRREREMLRVRQMKSLQKFASVHAIHTTSISNAT